MGGGGRQVDCGRGRFDDGSQPFYVPFSVEHRMLSQIFNASRAGGRGG